MTEIVPRTSGPPSADDPPDSAFSRLREALAEAGLVLPSLDLDPAFFGGGRLVQLGRVNAATADRLASVISRGTER